MQRRNTIGGMLQDLAERLTIGCRILAEQDIIDAYGHLSARLADDERLFVMNRGISPALVEPKDFIVLNWEGQVVEGDGLPVYRGAGLVNSVERGEKLAATLGPGSAALLRGHGDVVAAGDVSATVLKALSLRDNADVLHELIAHGGKVDLWNAEDVAAWAAPMHVNVSREAAALLANKAWDYYAARVDGRLAALLGQSGTRRQ